MQRSIRPDRGNAVVDGYDTVASPLDVLDRIGALPDIVLLSTLIGPAMLFLLFTVLGK